MMTPIDLLKSRGWEGSNLRQTKEGDLYRLSLISSGVVGQDSVNMLRAYLAPEYEIVGKAKFVNPPLPRIIYSGMPKRVHRVTIRVRQV